MTAAAKSMSRVRHVLGVTPRAGDLWLKMTESQRKSVLIAAGFPRQWSARDWLHFTLREQVKIMDQVTAFAAWADKLQVSACQSH